MAHVHGSDNAVWFEEHDSIPLKQRLKLLLANKRFPGYENAELPPTSNGVVVKKEYDRLDSLDFHSSCSSSKEKTLTQEQTPIGGTEEYRSPNQMSAGEIINANGSNSLLPSPLSNFPVKVKVENPDDTGVSIMENCANSSLVTDVQAIDEFNTQIPDDILDELDHVVLRERQRMLLSRKESSSAAKVLQDNSSGLFSRVVDSIVQRTKTAGSSNEMVSGVPPTTQGFSRLHCSQDDKVKHSANLIQPRDIDPICSSNNILSKHESSGGVKLLSGATKTMLNSKITELVNVKIEPLDSSQVERTNKGSLPNLTFSNVVQVKTRFEIPDDSFEDKLDHMFLSERMNLLASKDLHHLNKCENSESSSKVVPPTFDFQPVASEYATPLKINRPRKRRKTATDSVGTALEEDAPGLLEVLIDKGVSLDEMKLYGQKEYDGVLDESSIEDSFSELEAVISKLFDQRNSLLKFAPLRCNKVEKASYCLACLFSLVEQARYLRFRSWPVEWGWCRDLQSFIFVFERHNRIVLERPEYGYATYFFELVDSLSVDWQVKRLVTAMKLTSCSRVTLIENKPLMILKELQMGKTGRDWTQIYAIYGVDDWQTPLFLLIHAIVFSALSVFFLLYFEPICYFSEHFVPLLGPSSARFAAGFTGSVTALSAVCLYFAAGNIFYSSVSLHWEMAQRMVNAVPDWSTVKHALDLGCGRGILLNAVALQLKKSGSSGRVVGLDPARNQARTTSKSPKPDTLSTLKTASLEGVQEYVTCRAGDPRTLPFGDNYFDVVASGVFLHTVGKEFGQKTAAAAAERMRALGEVVRVLKPGGVGVVWDLVHVPEYVQRLHELKMEDIRVSERVTAFMVSSHIVSFRKPSQHWIGSNEVRLDWRFNNLC